MFGDLGEGDKRHYVEGVWSLGTFWRYARETAELRSCVYQQVMTAELDVHIAFLVHSISNISLWTSIHVLFHTCLECLLDNYVELQIWY